MHLFVTLLCLEIQQAFVLADGTVTEACVNVKMRIKLCSSSHAVATSLMTVQALGYLSVNDTFDLNIVIRTAVFIDQPDAAGNGTAAGSSSSGSSSSSSSKRVMTIGAGGAVTVQSDAAAEFAEMQLKAERLLAAAAMAAQQQQQHSALGASRCTAAAPAAAATAATKQLGEPVRR
jgi:hypothetical protein